MIATRIHPEDIPLLEEMIAIARGTGADLNHEYRLQMPDGTVKHMHLVARGSRDANGELEYIGAIQDVTQRTRAEEALGKVRSELAHVARVSSLGTLTASIAHEVNQPLAGIVTNAGTCLRMLAGDPPNVAGAIETARRTMRDANRASAVITRLRALFGKKEVAAEAVDLNEAAREVIALVGGDLQRNKVLLRTELAEDLPPVMGDRIQLQQVILNLLLNGSDAMRAVTDRPRRLTLRTEPRGRRACPAVRRGRGHRLRSPGHRANVRSLPHDQGRRDGNRPRRQQVDRRKPRRRDLGGGRMAGRARPSRFTIPFGPEPARAAASARTGNGSEMRDSPVMRSLVCVVDDDESVRESLPDLLREFGFSARAFSSAPAFLEFDCLGECDCLLLDVAMPGMTGPELQQALKQRGQATPIVFITAHADDEVRPRLIAEGASECLFKPFNQADLLNALNRALGKV